MTDTLMFNYFAYLISHCSVVVRLNALKKVAPLLKKVK